MSGLRFAAPGFATLHASMLRETELETCAVVYAQANPACDAWVAAADAAELVPDGAYEQRTATAAVLKGAFLVDVANRARSRNLSPVFAHTHPHCVGVPVFSPVDDSGEVEIKAYLERHPIRLDRRHRSRRRRDSCGIRPA